MSNLKLWISLIALLCLGCSPIVYPHCCEQAIFNAVNWKHNKKEDVEIVIMHTENPYVDHAQARTSKGKWLQMGADRCTYTGRKDDGSPYKTLSLEEILKEMKLIGD
jgi:hypothetical protein